MKKYICVLFLVCNSFVFAQDKRPNILFIMSDDHAYQAISAYNDKLIQTPNIDKIAQEGILFSNASVTNSICAPSRATILTGKFSHMNGKVDNIFPFDTTQMTFPQLFQKAGYQTAMFGKLHFGNNPKGFDDFLILPGQGHYINPKFIGKEKDTIITGYVTDVITDLTLNWFDEKRDSSKPFLMMYLHKAPHRAWWPSPEKFEEFYQKEFPLPETLFDDYSNRASAASSAEMNIFEHMHLMQDNKVYPKTIQQMGDLVKDITYTGESRKIKKAGAGEFLRPFSRANKRQEEQYRKTLDKISTDFKNKWPNMSDKEKTIWKYQRYMQDYLATISSVDDNVGRVLDYLKENDLEDNTIVVYTSDQGFYLGEHGWFDKRFIYDESFKTPLLIRWPNKIRPGITNDEMVQNLDFAQTFLDAASIKAPKDMQGESLLPLLFEDQKKWTRDAVYYHYYEFPSVHMVKRHYGIISKKYKLVHYYYDIDEWEFLDRKADPNEMTNLYDDPKYQSIIQTMKKKLKKLRKKYKDSDELSQKYLY
ncbi:MAG: sulfatase family protein [Flavobacteriaceae bacterium]